MIHEAIGVGHEGVAAGVGLPDALDEDIVLIRITSAMLDAPYVDDEVEAVRMEVDEVRAVGRPQPVREHLLQPLPQDGCGGEDHAVTGGLDACQDDSAVSGERVSGLQPVRDVDPGRHDAGSRQLCGGHEAGSLRLFGNGRPGNGREEVHVPEGVRATGPRRGMPPGTALSRRSDHHD
ncbi:hypothetical protein ACIFUY_27970 [Streptomyces sp. CACIS-1.16CA]|uniref:hypothetical protein n=1 Tax=Streptomyces sp. CACIS-1.16CA TaxID=1175510 RepID=UPI0037D98EE3